MTSQCADTFSCSLNVVRMARIKQPRTIRNLQTHNNRQSDEYRTYNTCVHFVCVSQCDQQRELQLCCLNAAAQQSARPPYPDMKGLSKVTEIQQFLVSGDYTLIKTIMNIILHFWQIKKIPLNFTHCFFKFEFILIKTLMIS